MEEDKKYKSLQVKVSELEERIKKLELNSGTDDKRKLGISEVAAEEIPVEKVIEYNRPENNVKENNRTGWDFAASNKEETDWEHLIARVWLPRVFIVVLLIGIMWGFKAATDAGYINESIRVIIGFLVSAVLVWQGVLQLNQRRKTLGHSLLGGSIGLLTLSTFAGNSLYGIIPSSVAFVLNITWILLGIYFAKKYRSQSIAVLVSIVGVFVPFLVNFEPSNVNLFIVYELMLYGVFLIFSTKQRYAILYGATAFLLHISFGLFLLFSLEEWESLIKIIVAGAIMQHILLLIMVLRTEHHFKQQASVLFSSFVLTNVWANIAYDESVVSLGVFVAFVAYLVLSILLNAKKSAKLPILASISALSLMFFLFLKLENEFLSITLLSEGVIAFLLGCVIKSQLQRISGLAVYAMGIFSTVALMGNGIEKVISFESLNWIVLMVTLLVFGRVLVKYRKDFSTIDALSGQYIINGIVILIGLFFITEIIQAATQDMSTNVSRLSISAGWILYATAGLAYGILRQSKNMRMVGLGLLIITLLKVIFVDLPEVSILVRAILFVGLGLVGIIVSRVSYGKKHID